MARLKVKYTEEVAPALFKKFGYKSTMQIPKIEKVVLNVGCGEARENPKVLDAVVSQLSQITGQKAIITIAKKSVANFKLREGMPVGAKVTLRGDKMWEFLDRLFNVALPRVRDFRGISANAFDGRGNYALGIKEQLIFPEIEYDKIDKIRGMDIIIVTTAKTDEEGRALLQQGAAFFIGLSGGDNDDVHAADLVDLIVLDLGEDQLLLDAQGIVAAAVEGVGADAAEVADTGQSHVEQTIQELPHLVAPQGDLGADGHALTQLEVSHGLLGDGDDGLLAGDLGQLADDGVQNLGVLAGLAAADVQDHLLDLGDLHGALVTELLEESGSHFFGILNFQTCHFLRSPFSQFCAALLAGADFLAILQLIAHAGVLAALGADHLDLAGVDSGLALDDAALLALTAGLDVAGDHVAAFHNDLALAGDGAQHLTLLAAVLAGQDDNGVILLDLQTIHFSGPSIKQLRERGTGSSCNPCRAAHEQRAQRYGYLWGFCRP